MKKILFLVWLTLLGLPLAAQLYHPGEVLNYRVSYKAKMFPNTEVGSVEVTTTATTDENGRPLYRVEGVGRTLPTYRWFYNLHDTYTVYVDPERLLPVKFTSDLRESDYTFESTYLYDWEKAQVHTRWRSRKNPPREKTMPLDKNSLDAISLFFRMRASDASTFVEGRPETLDMVLQDTIRHLKYRFLGREVKKIRNMGKFQTLKFDCQLGTSEGFSFTDGTVFTIWISDDENKIPLYIESPVKIGSINAYISGYKGLKYPVKSKIK